jgi:hypothetical protein
MQAVILLLHLQLDHQQQLLAAAIVITHLPATVPLLSKERKWHTLQN